MAKKTRTAARFIYLCAACGEDILPGQEYKRNGNKKRHCAPTCERATSVLADEPSPPPDDFYWESLGSKSSRRCIRTFEAVARVEHSCWLCDRSLYHGQQMVSAIYPGERYWGEVFVGDKGWEVRNYHFCCPFDPIEEDMMREDEDYDDEEGEDFFEENLPLAA